MFVEKCKQCGYEYDMVFHEEEVEKNISKIYFQCPNCQLENFVSYMNADILRKKAELYQMTKQLQLDQGTSYPSYSPDFQMKHKLKEKEIRNSLELLRVRVEKI